MNSILICDIYLTLRNPFTSYEMRYTAYKWGSLLVTSLIIGSQMYDYFHGGQYIPNHWKEHQVEKMIFDTIFMYLVYILFVPTLVVFVTILVRIYSQGTSKDLKKLVRNRHGAYFCVYMLYVAFIIIDFRGNNMSHEYELWVAIASTSCGSVLAAVRLSEPYVWVEFRKYLICLKKSKSHD